MKYLAAVVHKCPPDEGRVGGLYQNSSLRAKG